ncbi:protein ZAR1-like [Macrobrachium rosenbergii]|uniref:protein ZAR1-like n=1 Tax=Macrobrachium rosenbergii TaxID=79674 RepID=UPI0034D45114
MRERPTARKRMKPLSRRGYKLARNNLTVTFSHRTPSNPSQKATALPRKMVALETVPENNLNPAPPGGLKPLGKMTSDPANGQEKENATAPPKKNKRSRRRKSKNQEQKKGGNEEKTEMKKLTPYQGPFSTCGMFHCQDCDREWFSAHSWADSYQKCNECNKGIYPYRQFPRRRSEGPKKEEAPPHPQGMCQKCMKLGHSCVKLYVDKTRSSAESFRREE